ncbi:hypothetical protein RIF29_34007 [Crotalaria pallida]|uniref:Esterase n=1 Tax=Crotalaria pallida TaxID=3830 RepID=A0AAN9EB84_CROPI
MLDSNGNDIALSNSLARPYPIFVDEELFEKESTVSKEKFGKVARVYIMSDQDKVIKEDFQRWMIDKHPPQEVKKIDGSDHYQMFSTPIQLFSCLEEISRKYY